MNKSPNKAHAMVKQAIADKTLAIPKRCELCGDVKEDAWTKTLFSHLLPNRRPFIVPHHWKGYDFPLDVWFVCYSCNALLRGYHSGSVSKEQIRKIFTHYVPSAKAARTLGLNNDGVNYKIRKGDYPKSVKLSSLLGINSDLKTDPWMIPKHLITGTNQ